MNEAMKEKGNKNWKEISHLYLVLFDFRFISHLQWLFNAMGFFPLFLYLRHYLLKIRIWVIIELFLINAALTDR